MKQPEPRHVHLVGAGGAGMSALARLYLQQGLRVSGSDENDSAALRDLAALGATVCVGHGAPLGDADLLVYSSAIPPDNPELVEARRRGIRNLKHAQALGELFNPRRGMAVAGTHGKTTTSAMIAYVLECCGHRPSFHVGGELIDLDTSARWNDGEWMVIEADEFDRRFLEYSPEIAVVLNMEPDHFEYYGTVEAMEAAFHQFLGRVTPNGWIVACGDDHRLAALLSAIRGRRTVRYGLGSGGDSPPAGCEWWAANVREVPGGSRFTACSSDSEGGVMTFEASLSLPGRHNVLNALAALAACAIAGLPAREAAAALAGFHGTRRRFQLVGEGRGVRVYEDYAHHPTEVRAVLAAARPLVSPEGRLWAVFQPHLRVRTERLFDEFSRAFGAADRVVLTDVYSPSGREPAGSYRGSRELVHAMGHPDARHTPDVDSARRLLLQEVRDGDVVLVMGAGTITRLAWQLAADLSAPIAHRTRETQG